MPVAVGDPAPDFTLPNAAGELVTLSQFYGKKMVVIYFYPKDDTPGCTTESCTFRDAYQDLQDAGAEVIGISSDSPESHRRFAERHRLPFTLLSDADGAVRRAFGVPPTLWILPGRVTYILDKAGIVRHLFNAQLQPKKHVAEALRVVRALAAGG